MENHFGFCALKSPQIRMKPNKNGPVIYYDRTRWWERMDSDHRSRKTTDLQSAPFGHSGTLPYKIGIRFGCLLVELVDGLEPPTC